MYSLCLPKAHLPTNHFYKINTKSGFPRDARIHDAFLDGVEDFVGKATNDSKCLGGKVQPLGIKACYDTITTVVDTSSSS